MLLGRDPRIKPAPGAELDRDHPFARSLRVAFMPTFPGPQPDALGQDFAVGGAPAQALGPHGPAVAYDGSTAYHRNSTVVLPTTSCTVLLICNPTSSASTGSSFGNLVAGPAETVSQRLQCHLPYSGTLYWDFGGFGGANRTSWTPAGGFFGTWHTIALRAGTRGISIWADGAVRASSGTAISRAASTAGFDIGQFESKDAPVFRNATILEQFLLLDRELLDTEIRQWEDDPWGLILPPTLRWSLILGSVGGGAQTLALPALASAATPFAPAVVPGPVTVAPPTIASTATLAAPTLSAGGTGLVLPTIASTASVNPPALSVGGTALVLSSIASTATVHAPAVAPGAVTLAPPAIASTAALFPPALAVQGTVSLPTIASAATANPPALVPGPVALTLPTITSTATVHAPAVGVGASSVALPTIASTATVFAPAVAPGPVILTLPSIAPASLVWPPALVYAQGLTLPSIVSTAAAYPPALHTISPRHGPSRFRSLAIGLGPDPTQSTALE